MPTGSFFRVVFIALSPYGCVTSLHRENSSFTLISIVDLTEAFLQHLIPVMPRQISVKGRISG